MYTQQLTYVLYLMLEPSELRACPMLDPEGDTGNTQWTMAVLPHGAYRMVRSHIKSIRLHCDR